MAGTSCYCLAVSITWSDRWYLSLAREINELTLILATFVHWGGGVTCSKLICVSDRAAFERNIWSSCHAGHVCSATSARGSEGHLCLSTRWLGLCHPACLFCKGVCLVKNCVCQLVKRCLVLRLVLYGCIFCVLGFSSFRGQGRWSRYQGEDVWAWERVLDPSVHGKVRYGTVGL